jgi:hypothetical protein
LLDLDAKIYFRDQTDSCKTLVLGGACDSEPYGSFHTESKKEGDLIYSKGTFSGPEGVQLTEETWDRDGHIMRAQVENKALKKNYELEVKKGRVYYKTTELETGKITTADDEAEDNLVVPATFIPYLRNYAHELLDGKEVRIKVVVLDRKDSYTFNVKKVRDEKGVDGQPIAVFTITPNSFFIKALIDPLYLYIKPANFELLAFEGRSPLHKKVGDDYKEFESRTIYYYHKNLFKVPAAAVADNCANDTQKIGEAKCVIPTDATPATSSTKSE